MKSSLKRRKNQKFRCVGPLNDIFFLHFIINFPLVGGVKPDLLDCLSWRIRFSQESLHHGLQHSRAISVQECQELFSLEMIASAREKNHVTIAPCRWTLPGAVQRYTRTNLVEMPFTAPTKWSHFLPPLRHILQLWSNWNTTSLLNF